MTTVNLKTASELTGKSVNTLKSWFKQGCPVDQVGRQNQEWQIKIADVMSWREQQAINNAIGDVSLADADELRLRKLGAETVLAEILTAEKRGEVAEIATMEKIWRDHMIEFRTRVRQIPSRISSSLLGETDERVIKSILKEELDEALTVLSETKIEAEDEC